MELRALRLLDLHSTMYLLNLSVLIVFLAPTSYLHSTMYLLNLDTALTKSHVQQSFTFHYVSIKSSWQLISIRSLPNLHSTMYLLNRRLIRCKDCINYDLHSTMYLLNPAYTPNTDIVLKFTFHYVSIKSDRMEEVTLYMLIYIPLCIY